MSERQFHWPNNARVALVFHMAWEAWPDDLGTPESRQNGGGRPLPPEAKYRINSHAMFEHAFAETSGLQRLMRIYDKWEVPVSCVMSGASMEAYPSLARELDERGYELGIQPWEHEYLYMYDAAEERQLITRSYDKFESLFGRKPSGFVGPGFICTDNTYEILADLDVGWTLAGLNCDTPYVVKVEGKKSPLVFQPLKMTDYDSYGAKSMAPRDVLAMMRDDLDTMYEEGETGVGKMLAYATHPFLASGFRTRPLEDFIEYAKSLPGVWITTRREITDWVVSEFPDLTLDALYGDVAVASDRRYHLNLGLGA